MRSMDRIVVIAAVSLLGMGVAVAETSGPEKSGSEVYEESCANCHSGGFGGFFSGAPEVGDSSDWTALLDKGVDGLVAATLTGIGKMAARGGCQDCTDEQIRAAVEYMVAESR